MKKSGANQGMLASLRRWHRWGGLLIVVVLLVVALSGMPLVFRGNLVNAFVTSGATLPSGYSPADMARQLDRIARTYPEQDRIRIKAPMPQEPYWGLSDAAGNLQLLSATTLAPYERNLWLLDALMVMRSVHTHLVAGVVGEFILLACGLIGVALCISGLAIWWPVRSGFRLRWVLPARIDWYYVQHSHRHLGALCAALVLISLVTATMMLWQKLVGPITTPAGVTHYPAPERLEPSALPSQQLLLALEAVPDGWPTYVQLPSGDHTAGSVRMRLPGEWHINGRTAVSFATGSVDVSVSERADRAPFVRDVMNRLYPLHSSYGMGTAYRLSVFAAGIATAWLCLTGILKYVRAPRARRLRSNVSAGS
jgi:uncharacterized iron-regulated membrane protein